MNCKDFCNDFRIEKTEAIINSVYGRAKQILKSPSCRLSRFNADIGARFDRGLLSGTCGFIKVEFGICKEEYKPLNSRHEGDIELHAYSFLTEGMRVRSSITTQSYTRNPGDISLVAQRTAMFAAAFSELVEIADNELRWDDCDDGKKLLKLYREQNANV